MNFLKNFFSSCLGAFVALLLFAILGIFFIVGLGAEKPVQISAKSVLHLKLNYPITELELEDPISDIFPEATDKTIGLIQLKEAIENAKTDANIEGIYLSSGWVNGGLATIAELRSALEDFRASGKWVVTYSNYFSEGGYYLATASDKIFLNPEGMLELNGLATEATFLKNLFDKLEIKPQVFRVGDFKSAVEPFLRETMSDENRLQMTSILESMNNQMVTEMAQGRNIESARMAEISTKMLSRNAKHAFELGLVDSLQYEDQVLDILKEKIGVGTSGKINLVDYDSYKKSYSSSKSTSNKIAVIVADGDILPGESDQGVVGGATIEKELEKARKDKNVKAVVLRINSPGGSFQASDEMWRQVVLTKAQKPVIASMGDYAASGGYYLAMACDTIVAKPTTITGSIGVFSILFDISGLMRNKLGITTQEIKTGEIGNLFSITRPLSETEKSIWQKQTEEVYETFTTKAANGRGMNVEDLKKIASGRVWTGEQALENGLVDVLGGLNESIRIAAEAAGIGNDYNLRYSPKPKTFMERYLGGQGEEIRDKKLAEALGGENSLLYKQWKKAEQWQGIQARMPFEIRFK